MTFFGIFVNMLYSHDQCCYAFGVISRSQAEIKTDRIYGRSTRDWKSI